MTFLYQWNDLRRRLKITLLHLNVENEEAVQIVNSVVISIINLDIFAVQQHGWRCYKKGNTHLHNSTTPNICKLFIFLILSILKYINSSCSRRNSKFFLHIEVFISHIGLNFQLHFATVSLRATFRICSPFRITAGRLNIHE